MDGLTLLTLLREAVGEPSGSQYLNNFLSYMCLWEAATELNRRTRTLRTTTTVTTVADQTGYVLPADFLEIDLRDEDGDKSELIKYSDGTSTYFLRSRDYDRVVFANQTTSVSVPDTFTIIDYPSLYSQITGTATSIGAAAAGVSTLTDSSGLFTTTDYVSAGDIVHNTTADSIGVVLSVTSATALSTAMFDNTTFASEGWAENDAYVIQPQGRLKLVFDPPPSTASHTATVYYIQRPAPVFHNYGVYRFPSHYLFDLVDYAASRYKLREREPGYAQQFRAEWEGKVRASGNATRKAMHRGGFTMSLRGRRR